MADNRKLVDLTVDEFWASQPKPGTAAGIPIEGPRLVADVVKPVIGPVHGKDYLTAQDLMQFPEAIRPVKISDAALRIWMEVDPEHRFPL